MEMNKKVHVLIGPSDFTKTLWLKGLHRLARGGLIVCKTPEDVVAGIKGSQGLIIDRALDGLHHSRIDDLMEPLHDLDRVVVIATHNPIVINSLVIDDAQEQILFTISGQGQPRRMNDEKAAAFESSYAVGIQNTHEILIDLGLD